MSRFEVVGFEVDVEFKVDVVDLDFEVEDEVEVVDVEVETPFQSAHRPSLFRHLVGGGKINVRVVTGVQARDRVGGPVSARMGVRIVV